MEEPKTMRGHVVICPYCQEAAPLLDGEDLYPHRPDLYGKKFYVCRRDHAWVGCHPGTAQPLGRLADATLRRAKSAAHAAFDPLWKTGKMTRKEAYAWLGQQMGMPPEQTHIGMFDTAQCVRVVDLCRAPGTATRSSRGPAPATTKRTNFSLVERGPEIMPWD